MAETRMAQERTQPPPVPSTLHLWHRLAHLLRLNATRRSRIDADGWVTETCLGCGRQTDFYAAAYPL